MIVIFKIFRDLFFVSISILFLLLMAEDLQSGFVTLWFNFNYLIIVVIISGFLALIFSKDRKNSIINH